MVYWDFEGDTHGQVPQFSAQRPLHGPFDVATRTASPSAQWWSATTTSRGAPQGTLSPQRPNPYPTGTAFWEQLQQRKAARAASGGLTVTPSAYIRTPSPNPTAGSRAYRRATRTPRDWGQWVENNGTLRLIPWDEEKGGNQYIGSVQDWGNGSFVVAQVNDEWQKRRLQYERGKEALNPQIALGWSPSQVTAWRDKVRFLSQWMDLGTGGAPFGVTANDWTEADAAAMEWFMAWSNENGTSVDQATETWLSMAQDGSLDNWGEQEGEGADGGGGMEEEEIPLLERRVERVFTLHDLDDARALLTSQIANLLGRQPRDREVSEFLTALNTRAKANPTVTTYDYTYDEFNHNIETETTVDPGRGFDSVAMARKRALAGNEGEMERYHLGLAQDVLAELAGM